MFALTIYVGSLHIFETNLYFFLVSCTYHTIPMAHAYHDLVLPVPLSVFSSLIYYLYLQVCNLLLPLFFLNVKQTESQYI